MRAPILVILVSLVIAYPVMAEKAPLRQEALQQEAYLTVVGEIEKLRIETEQSRLESGFGNYDWAIYLTIKVATVEKGGLTKDEIEVRCFRIKSRRSRNGYLTSSGNHPIPEEGTLVKAYLQGSPGSWEAIIPNGLKSPVPDAALVDAPQVMRLSSGRFTYLLPAEIWLLLGLAAGFVVLIWKLVMRRPKPSGA